jgi:ammonia channel protein AmtB
MSYASFLISLTTWLVIGYSFAFSGTWEFIGDFDQFLLLSTE